MKGLENLEGGISVSFEKLLSDPQRDFKFMEVTVEEMKDDDVLL